MKIQKTSIRTFILAEEGLVANENIGEGRFIPALAIDFEDNQDIIDLFKAHASIIAGDASTAWCQHLSNRKELILKICFLRPMVIEFGIKFNIEEDCMLIDGIMQSKGLLVRPGKKGEKISQTQENTILIEIPKVGMKDKWEEMFLKTITKKYRKKGIPKKESKEMAIEQIRSVREFWKFRKKKEK